MSHQPPGPVSGSQNEPPPAPDRDAWPGLGSEQVFLTRPLEGEQRFRSLVESMTEGVALHELVYEGERAVDYRVLEVNPTFEAQTGISAEAAQGRLASELYGAGEAPYLKEFARVAESGAAASFEAYFARLERHFRIGVVCPAPGCFATVFEDVTERKRAEEERERLAELLDLSFDAMIVWRLGGEIESWNRGAGELYGFSKAEALGRSSHDLLATIHQRPWPQIEAALREHGTWEGEVRHHAKDGREVVVSSRLQLMRGGDGVERVLETNRDISDRKRAEEALRSSEQRLLQAQRVAHVGSWEWEIESGSLSWSPELYEIYGLDPDAFTPTMESFAGFVHPADRGLVDEAVGQILASGGRTDFEFRILAADGSVRELHAVGEVTATGEDGAPRVMIGVNEDVTERRQAERALRENEAAQVAQEERGRVARDLHDSVTQALFAATMKAEALAAADDALSGEASRLAEEVRRLSRGALAQLRTMLLELRGGPLEDEPVGQLLRQLVEGAECRASVNVQLTLRGDLRLPPGLHEPIYRIAEEALNNVTRHARAAMAWVDLDVGPERVRLVVGDDGCGFALSAGDPALVGLRSMRDRAEATGAQFDVATAPGDGTVITVDWPTDPVGAGR